jgi:hypothetical protein
MARPTLANLACTARGQHPAHKVITYVEYRIMSGVFQNDPPHPLPPASVSFPCTTGTHGEGWGFNILEDAGHWIGLFQNNPSTIQPVGSGWELNSGSGSWNIRAAGVDLPLRPDEWCMCGGWPRSQTGPRGSPRPASHPAFAVRYAT